METHNGVSIKQRRGGVLVAERARPERDLGRIPASMEPDHPSLQNIDPTQMVK